MLEVLSILNFFDISEACNMVEYSVFGSPHPFPPLTPSGAEEGEDEGERAGAGEGEGSKEKERVNKKKNEEQQ